MELTDVGRAWCLRAARTADEGAYVRVKYGASSRRGSSARDRVDIVPGDEEATTAAVEDMLAAVPPDGKAWLELMQRDRADGQAGNPVIWCEVDPLVAEVVAQRQAAPDPGAMLAQAFQAQAVAMQRLAVNADHRANDAHYRVGDMFDRMLGLMEGWVKSMMEGERLRAEVRHLKVMHDVELERAEETGATGTDGTAGRLFEAWIASKMGIDPRFLLADGGPPGLPGPPSGGPKAGALAAVGAFRQALVADPSLLDDPDLADALAPLIGAMTDKGDDEGHEESGGGGTGEEV